MRSINGVVDISNLVLLETGNPVHFYDRARVAQTTLVARRGRPGERLRTIDEVDRRVDSDMLVIADGERVVGVAGVMGGLDTEIGESTRDVLVEAACFQPASVRTTARRLGLHTEASHRFERGVDPDGVVRAQVLAARLLEEIAGGQAESSLIDIPPQESAPRDLILRPHQLLRLLGYQPDAGAVEAALAALQLLPRRIDATSIRITVPSWRMDLEREADLVEEVARHIGYDAIPTRGADALHAGDPAHLSDLAESARDRLAHLGFHEAIGYAMIAPGEDEAFLIDPAHEPIALTRPIAESLACLRRSLLPGLLQAVDLNVRRGVRDVRLFEIGHVFLPGKPGEFPDEPLRAALAWTGAGRPRHFSSEQSDVDLFDVAGAVEQLIMSLRPGTTWSKDTGHLPALDPGRSVEWRLGTGDRVAWAGALHPERLTKRTAETFLAEIDLSLLSRVPARTASHASIPRLNSVSRDLALVMNDQVTFADVLSTLRSVTPPCPVVFRPIDRYAGPPLADDQSSLTVRLTLQPARRSLTEAEIEDYRLAVIAALKKTLSLDIRG
jgi:phenylalanyl-tRNA synthetase beta chain